MRILGIDPGSKATGYGVVEHEAGRLVHVAHGTLGLARRGAPLAERLRELHARVREIVSDHRPDAVAVEEVFVSASPRAALVLGQARGAVLAAVGATGLAVAEYSASQVKQAVTGSGRADKHQVRRMVRQLLALEALPATDAADALAVAIRHAHGGRLEALGVVARRSPRRGGRGLRWRVRPAP